MSRSIRFSSRLRSALLIAAQLAELQSSAWSAGLDRPSIQTSPATQSTSCLPRYARLAPEFRQTPAQFKAAHQEFNSIAHEHNLRWIDLAENPPPNQNLIFVSTGNSLLKEHNEKILKDKDLATAVTNRSKEIGLDETRSSPLLGPAIEAFYSDFKDFRYVVRDAAPDAVDQHKKIVSEIIRSVDAAAQRYGNEIRNLNLTYHAPARDPGSWILAGYGSTADEAGAAAKINRRFAPHANSPSKRTTRALSFEEASPYIEQDNHEAAQLLSALDLQLGRSDLFTVVRDEGQAHRIPTPAAFDAIRKASTLSDTELAASLSSKFKTRVPPETIGTFRNYLERVNASVPDNTIAERVRIPLEKAEHGAVSVDFAGQNSRNLYYTAIAMASAQGKGARAIIRSARQGEKKSTELLNQLKSEVERAAWGDKDAGLPLSAHNERRAIYFSGDDGMIFPDRPLDLRGKRAFLKRLATGESPSNFRVTFLPPKDTAGKVIPPDSRMGVIQTGEAFEKDMRDLLSEKLGMAASQKVMLAMDLELRADGEVGLRVLAVSPTSSPAEKKAVIETIQALSKDKKVRVTGLEFLDLKPTAPTATPKPLSDASAPWRSIPAALLPIRHSTCSLFVIG